MSCDWLLQYCAECFVHCYTLRECQDVSLFCLWSPSVFVAMLALFCSHCPVTVQSLSSHCPVTVQSLSSHCPVLYSRCVQRKLSNELPLSTECSHFSNSQDFFVYNSILGRQFFLRTRLHDVLNITLSHL